MLSKVPVEMIVRLNGHLGASAYVREPQHQLGRQCSQLIAEGPIPPTTINRLVRLVNK